MIGKRVRIKTGHQCEREGQTGLVIGFNKVTGFGKCWYVLLDIGHKGSYAEPYLEIIEDFKVNVQIGSRVDIVESDDNKLPSVYLGKSGTVIKLSCPADRAASGKNCWWVQLDGGMKRSFSEKFLQLRGTFIAEQVVQEEPEPEPEVEVITLEMVTEAKKAVDKAQADFVELLSRYQVQEASK